MKINIRNKISYKYLLALTGFLLVCYCIWFRFIRGRLPLSDPSFVPFPAVLPSHTFSEIEDKINVTFKAQIATEVLQQKNLRIMDKLHALAERGLLHMEEGKLTKEFYDHLPQNSWNKKILLSLSEIEFLKNPNFNIGLLRAKEIDENILLSGIQTHVVVIYSMEQNKKIIWGYLTSQKSNKTTLMNTPNIHNILIKSKHPDALKSLKEKANEILHDTVSVLANDPKKKIILSGLLTLPPEYYTKELLFQQEFNYVIVLMYIKVLHDLGTYNITNKSALFKNMKYSAKWIEMTGAMTQHVLRALFLGKTFSIEEFNNYMDNDVDFNQYKVGDILLLIECFIAKNTLIDLVKQISFTAINHEIPEEQRPGYSKKICKELTGQENADFHGKRAIASANGEISLETTHYKDAKTYESGILKGRLALCFDLYSNIQNTREHLSKLKSSLHSCLKKANINDEVKKALTELYKNIEKIRIKLSFVLENMPHEKSTKAIINPKDILTIKETFNEIYKLIRKAIANPDISQHINLGLSFDPGIDTDFITFIKNFPKIDFEKLFTKEEIKEILYNNYFDKEAHRQLIQRMLVVFPEEMRSSIQEAINYIDNK